MSGRVGNQFVGQPGVTALWLAPRAFDVLVGSPALAASAQGSAGSRIYSWEFDAASAEAVVATVYVPPSWGSFAVDSYWANSGGGSGDVVWTPQHYQFGAGDTPGSETTGTDVVATAGAQGVCVVTTVLASVARTADLFRIEIGRDAAEVADTLGNDCGMFGLLLRRLG